MQDYILVLKALGEPTRLRIMNLLTKEAETSLCVCEVVDALQESQYNISRHLQTLARAGLLESNKKGKWNYYRIKGDFDPYRRSLLQAIGTIPAETFGGDLERLRQRLALRVDGECV